MASGAVVAVLDQSLGANTVLDQARGANTREHSPAIVNLLTSITTRCRTKEHRQNLVLHTELRERSTSKEEEQRTRLAAHRLAKLQSLTVHLRRVTGEDAEQKTMAVVEATSRCPVQSTN